MNRYALIPPYKIGVQVNGKVWEEIEIAKGASQELAVQESMRQERVAFFLEGKAVKKVIYVPGRILNIVAK
jgi:leucyl-tRNA synthetase